MKGGEHLLHGALPEYPKRAAVQKVEGDVVVEMTLDDRGEVSDARVLSGPEELRRAALEAVLQWHYSPAAIHSTVTQATLRFHVPPLDLDARGKLEAEAPQEEGRMVYGIEKALRIGHDAEQRAELEAKHLDMAKVMEKIRVDEKILSRKSLSSSTPNSSTSSSSRATS